MIASKAKTTGHRVPWRLLNTLFKQDSDPDQVTD
jgi:hypothetical protein